MLNPIREELPPDVHAAAELGLVDRLRDLLHSDPSLVHAKGCDGGTPLHFAHDVAIAGLLVQHGAKLDARDDDHNSTPAQWRIRESPDVSRYLLAQGAAPDIFLATALGEIDLAAKLIEEKPACVGQRIGRLPEFPPIGYQGRGGTIYQWTLAFNSYPHQIALLKDYRDYSISSTSEAIPRFDCSSAAFLLIVKRPRESPATIPISSQICQARISSCFHATAGRRTSATTRFA